MDDRSLKKQADSARADTRVLRTLKRTDAEILTILDEMDRQDAAHDAARVASRYKYRISSLRIMVAHPGGSIVTYSVFSRWLAPKGLAFLHGSFLHAGTGCVAQLISPHGSWNDVPGVIGPCAYMMNHHAYEIEMVFSQEVDASLFCPEAASVRVLLADEDAVMADVVRAHLQQLNATVTVVRDGQEAMDQALGAAFDLIMLDLDLPKVPGQDAIKTLREKGYPGYAVAMTSMSRPSIRDECLGIGFNECLHKPATLGQLSKVLHNVRQEPLFSTLEADPVIGPLIPAFIKTLPAMARDIQDAATREDLATVERLVRTLKVQGPSLGFGLLGELAVPIEAGLIESHNLGTVRGRLRNLVQACLLARSSRMSN